jgi:hypothetical protein
MRTKRPSYQPKRNIGKIAVVTISLLPPRPHHFRPPRLTTHQTGTKLEVASGPWVTVDDNHDYPLLTVDEIIQLLAHFTPQQRSLAWSPQPPFESTGAGDCRIGGNCGLDFNHETARARWIQARYRHHREQKRQENRTREDRSSHDQ